MTRYADYLTRVGANAERTLHQLLAKLQAGSITRADFDDTARAVLQAAADQAAALADVALAKRLSEMSGDQVDPLGLAAADVDAADELKDVDGGGGSVKALTVAAFAVVAAAGQAVFTQGLRDHGVPGWHRVHYGTSKCEPCNNLTVAPFLPSRISMWTHRGCQCHQDPVLVDPEGDSDAVAAGDRPGVEDGAVPGRDPVRRGGRARANAAG